MMQFRSNIGLKVFALILFTLEFLAPTMLVEFTPYVNAPKKALLVNYSTYHNALFSVFFEELYENEETKEFTKANSLGSPFSSEYYSHLSESDHFISIPSSSSFLQSVTHLPFFLLQHRFLI